MSINAKNALLGAVATISISPVTSLAHDNIDKSVENNNERILSESLRAITEFNKAGVVKGISSNDSLNIRSKADSTSSIIGRLKNGADIVITGKESNGWYRVSYKNKVGYVSEKYITLVGDISFKKTTEALNIRAGAGTKYTKLGEIPKGATARILSTSNGWSKVSYDGIIGYSLASYFVSESPVSDEAMQTLNKTGEVYNISSSDTLNLRTTPNNSGKVAYTVKSGTKLKITGKNSDGWYKINYNGSTVYGYEKYIKIVQESTSSSVDIEVMSTQGKVIKTSDFLNVRELPNTNSKTLGTVKLGSTVSITGKDKKTGWYRINFNGNVGYVSNYYIEILNSSSSNNSTTTTTTYKKTTENLNMRTGAGTNYSIIVQIPKGTSVKVLSTSNGWDKIEYNEKTGYCSNSYLVATSEIPTVKKVTTANVNFRSGAGTSYSIIKSLSANTVVESIETIGDWEKVKVNNQIGYINKSYLKLYTGESSSSGSSSTTKPNASFSKYKIVIDAGHGGKDSGAVGSKYKEKDIVLSISKKVNSKLQALGFKTIMTRSTDVYLSLSERYRIANNNNADAFVSIHANATSSSSVHGIETLYKNYKTLANDIQNELIKKTGAKSRGLKYRSDLAVLNGTKMPSALVEVGFISNASEENKMGTNSYQESLANGIVEGIVNYVK